MRALVSHRVASRADAGALTHFGELAEGVLSTLVRETSHMKGLAALPAIASRSLVVFLCSSLALSSFPAWGYTPESPKVQQMLAGSVAYLATSPSTGDHCGLLGGRCLIGLALYKYHKRFGDGSIPDLTRAALNLARAEGRNPQSENGLNNYSLGIALIFLTEVEPTRNTLEISNLLDEMAKRQRPHGGWGYPYQQTGDTSQTQYAVLGMWAAKSVGLNPSRESVDKVANWLLRTQDPSGTWGYQGADPGTFTRVPQSKTSHSMGAAGLGSVYVAADFLGLSRQKTVRDKKVVGKLPPALIPVVEDRGGARIKDSMVEIGRVRQSMSDGNTWFQNNFTIYQDAYPYYYLYGMERYQSFRELVEDTYDAEPRWYNEGVELLAERQDRNGSFKRGGSTASCDAPVGTAFATLFLLRSTRETIENVIDRDGILRGGRGLPTDLSDIRLRDNQIVAPAITGTVTDMIGMLEDEEGEKIENLLENPDALSLSGLTDAGDEFRDRLLRVARSGSYKARIVAVRMLGKQADLDNVPMLIYALTDQDPRVQAEADSGLKLISRKFDGVGLPDRPEPSDLKAAIAKWKAWYKTIRPDATFIEPATQIAQDLFPGDGM